jgi:hypothetical protein
MHPSSALGSFLNFRKDQNSRREAFNSSFYVVENTKMVSGEHSTT